MNGNFAILFLIVMLGSVALPLTNGFVGEFLLINGIYQYGAWIAAFAGLTVILGAVYMLRSYQTIMLGDRKDSAIAFGSLSSSDNTSFEQIVFSVVVTAFAHDAVVCSEDLRRGLAIAKASAAFFIIFISTS